jgi:non-canonical (house-cleaning) NTP pyrophosphatase
MLRRAKATDNAVGRADNAVKHQDISVAYEGGVVEEADISVTYADSPDIRPLRAVSRILRADVLIVRGVFLIDALTIPAPRKNSQ